MTDNNLKIFLGIDIGSVSMKYALVREDSKILKYDYRRTHGEIVSTLKSFFSEIADYNVNGIATTGSARKFVAELIGADFAIDEITAHRNAVAKLYPKVKTVFEIGGQDSKFIALSGSEVRFEMNNVCAAGTGSFLDQQAARLQMNIADFFNTGKRTNESHNIASKCTVFAESDMVHAQQSGVPLAEIIRGVHHGLVKNYLAQLCAGKKLEGEFLFEGGVSENDLLVEEFQNQLIKKNLINNPSEFIIPRPYNTTMGAIGVAFLCAKKELNNLRPIPQIRDFKFLENKECFACHRSCGAQVNVVEINNKTLTLGKSCQQ